MKRMIWLASGIITATFGFASLSTHRSLNAAPPQNVVQQQEAPKPAAKQDQSQDAAQSKPKSEATQSTQQVPAPAQGQAAVVPKPKWRVGDRWVIETATRPLQSRVDQQVAQEAVRLRWQFHVVGVEKLSGRDVLRVSITCLDTQAPQPRTTIWVDQQSLAMRQVQTQLPVPGGFRTITESYSVGEQAMPVLGPLTVLPIDLPAFVLPGSKDLGHYEYETTSGVAGTKAIGDLGFAFTVKQTAHVAEPSRVKGLFENKLVKDLKLQPTVDVTLATADREVRQVWQANLPWAAYSNNGSTEARLVEVQPAAEAP